MSGYPVPPAQPSSRARGGARVAETPKSVLLERVGAGLGVLMFVWGFLPWYGLAATDVNGYGFGSPAPSPSGCHFSRRAWPRRGCWIRRRRRRSCRSRPPRLPCLFPSV